MDADVLQLVREERILEAARLSSDRGDAAGASALFERACDWRSAASESLRAGAPHRGLELALRAGDEALARRAIANIAAEPGGVERAAAQLVQRGHFAWAARLFEAVGRELDAARAWERAGEMPRAAALFERSGEAGHAARVLEAALRRDPGDGAAAVALGALLVRFGKVEAGVRAFQRVPAQSPERREALTHLVDALRELGYAEGASEAAAELLALVAPIAPDRAPAAAPASASAPASEPASEPAPAPAPAPEPEPEPEPALERTPAPPTLLYGRYELVRQVASSARARVLEGVDRARGERVALKVFACGDAEGTGRAAFARLEADVRALRALDHPAIVPIRDFQRAGPTVVLAWMDGGTLEQRLAQGPVSPARAAEIACAVLGALGVAHRLGILHRDVKAANVLFDAAGAARLADFGTAHAADASATVTAGDLGALATLSPEQRDGREATARSDLFAVGTLLGQMLRGATGLEARHDAAVARLTAVDPSSRPADAFQARDLLLSLPWPEPASAMGHHAGSAPLGPARGAPGPQGPPPVLVALARPDRLERRADGRVVDEWTGRAIECVPLSDETLERARLFARAEHGALQTVLRVDREGGCVWLAACAARVDRPLTVRERSRLEEALEALHVAGAPRGPLDPDRVALDPSGEVVLRF